MAKTSQKLEFCVMVESTLNKEHSAVAHHFTRWNVAAEVCPVGWIPTALNPADVMTQPLPEAKRDNPFCSWAHKQFTEWIAGIPSGSGQMEMTTKWCRGLPGLIQICK